jgi:cysteine synthase A
MSLRNRTYDNIVQAAFDTPMVQLQRLIDPALATVFVKLEYFNPMHSVKDRIGVAMIDDAEKKGIITPGKTRIVEPTSGNTGIALAFVCASRGYKLTLTMPETMSVERRLLLRALGAELVLTPDNAGMGASIATALDIVEADSSAWMPMQFENPANPAVHEATTGPEIWADTAGKIDAIVTGVGTGGTITGITRAIRKHNKKFMAIAVEPTESPVLTGGKPANHDIQGIGAGFVPRNCDTSLLDGVIHVSSQEAYEWTMKLPKAEGIFGGISTGANVCGVAKAIEKYKLHGKRIVTIGCSFGERYLSTKLFDPLRD